jgi:hypothetical protein
LADFYRRHPDELTDLASRLHARSCRSHDGWVAALKAFGLDRLRTSDPIVDND